MNELPQIELLAPNFTRIWFGDTSVWFSYKTAVAFSRNGSRVCRVNDWGPTTGKHLNAIEPNKSRRVSAEEFARRWEEVSK